MILKRQASLRRGNGMKTVLAVTATRKSLSFKTAFWGEQQMESFCFGQKAQKP